MVNGGEDDDGWMLYACIGARINLWCPLQIADGSGRCWLILLKVDRWYVTMTRDYLVELHKDINKYHVNLTLYFTPTNLKHIEEVIIIIPETPTTVEEYRHNEL